MSFLVNPWPTNGSVDYVDETLAVINEVDDGLADHEARIDVLEAGGGGSFTLAADSGASQTISPGNTLTVVGGAGIDSVASATDTVTLNVDATVVRTTGAQTLTSKTLTSPAITTPTGIVKGDVGLGNVDNTSNATERAATATLANKTLTTPTISSTGFTNAQHAHTGATSGGQLTDAALSAAVGIAKGGSGQTSANAALNAFLPSQASNAGKSLLTDATNTAWGNPAQLKPKPVPGAIRLLTSRQLQTGGIGGMGLIPSTSYAMPIAIAGPCTIDRIGFYVTTLGGTTTVVALYLNDGTNGPGTRVATGSLTTTSTGLKLATISVAITVPQIVWVALNADNGTVNFETVQFITNAILGVDASSRDFSGFIKTADGAGASLPTPWNGTTFWNGGADQCPNAYLRVS